MVFYPNFDASDLAKKFFSSLKEICRFVTLSRRKIMSGNFKKLVESFYGSTIGNVQSPVWLCGLEWGGGCDPKTPILESEFEPYSLEDIQATSLQDFIDSFWDAHSPFCRNTMKVLCELYNCTDPGEKASYCQSWETWERLGIVGANGLALVLNAFPISFGNRDVAAAQWNEYKVRTMDDAHNTIPLRDWTGLNSFWEYKDFVVKHRSKIYSNERKFRKPKLIICFGKQSLDNFLDLWAVEDKNPAMTFNFDDPFNLDFESKSNPNCFAYWADETLVAVVPFPNGPSGLTSDERIKNVSTWLYNAVFKKYGYKWLPVTISTPSPKTSGPSKEAEVLWEIGQFQRLVNQQLSCLERLGNLTSILSNSLYSTREGQKKFESLKETLLRDYLHEFDALKKEMKDQQKQKS